MPSRGRRPCPGCARRPSAGAGGGRRRAARRRRSRPRGTPGRGPAVGVHSANSTPAPQPRLDPGHHRGPASRPPRAPAGTAAGRPAAARAVASSRVDRRPREARCPRCRPGQPPSRSPPAPARRAPLARRAAREARDQEAPSSIRALTFTHSRAAPARPVAAAAALGDDALEPRSRPGQQAGPSSNAVDRRTSGSSGDQRLQPPAALSSGRSTAARPRAPAGRTRSRRGRRARCRSVKLGQPAVVDRDISPSTTQSGLRRPRGQVAGDRGNRSVRSLPGAADSVGSPRQPGTAR